MLQIILNSTMRHVLGVPPSTFLADEERNNIITPARSQSINLFSEFLPPLEELFTRNVNSILSSVLNRSLNENRLRRDESKKIKIEKTEFKLTNKDLEQFLKNNKKKIPPERQMLIRECIRLKLEKKIPYVTCSICTDEFKNNMTIYRTPCCKQRIHCNCLEEWVKYKMTCPFCNRSLKSYQI